MKIEYLQNLSIEDIIKAQEHIKNSVSYAEDLRSLFLEDKFLTEAPESIKEQIDNKLGVKIENYNYTYSKNPFNNSTESQPVSLYFLVYTNKGLPMGAIKFNPLMDPNTQCNITMTLFSAYRGVDNYIYALLAVCKLIDEDFHMRNIIIDSHDTALNSAIEGSNGRKLNRVYNIRDGVRYEYNRYVIFFD